MDDLTTIQVIPIVISVISLIVSLFALFINWRKFSKEKPKIVAFVKFARYFRDVTGYPKRIILRMSILFENEGQAPGSVVDIIAAIRYQEQLFRTYPNLKSQFDKFSFSDRPINYFSDCPFVIQANGAISKEFDFYFDEIVFEYIDRCQRWIDPKDPKKWEWVDLPIIVQVIADTSSGKVELKHCVYRDDQEESKEVMGTIYYPIEGLHDDFEPKID